MVAPAPGDNTPQVVRAVTATRVPLVNHAVVASCRVPPALTSTSGGSTKTKATGATTLMVVEAVRPSTAAVTETGPWPTALSSPPGETVTRPGLPLDHVTLDVTSVEVPSLKPSVAWSCSVSPWGIWLWGADTIRLTGTGAGV